MSPSTDRQTFRETVALVAAKARARLPEAVNGRLESAVKLVLQGDVEPLEDGTIRVGSSDPTRWYHLVGPTCTCTDFVQGKAPDGWCKHRISAGIQKRVGEVLAAQTAQDGPVAPGATLETSRVADAPQGLPEAPASVNVRLTIRGRDCQLTLRDTSEERLLERLQTVLERFPGTVGASVPAGDQQGWAQTQHLNHEPQTAWNTLLINEL